MNLFRTVAMLTAACPLGRANVEPEIVVNEPSLFMESPVTVFDAPYINASGVVPPLLPPPPSDRPVPIPPHELVSICSARIANRGTIDL